MVFHLPGEVCTINKPWQFFVTFGIHFLCTLILQSVQREENLSEREENNHHQYLYNDNLVLLNLLVNVYIYDILLVIDNCVHKNNEVMLWVILHRLVSTVS